MTSLPELPGVLAEQLSGHHVCRTQTGRLGATIYQLVGPVGPGKHEATYLKTAPCDSGEDFAAEEQRLNWLRGKLPVPRVLYSGVHAGAHFLLLSAIEGKVAHDEAWQNDRARLMRVMAAGLLEIHGLPTQDCPFVDTLAHELDEAQRRTRDGELNREAFIAASEGRSPETVLDELRRNQVIIDDLVFTHGDYCMPNILLKDWEISGYVDWAIAGVSDRHRDLMCIVDTVTHNCGEEWLPVFFDAYGIADVDWQKIRFFSDLDLFYSDLG